MTWSTPWRGRNMSEMIGDRDLKVKDCSDAYAFQDGYRNPYPEKKLKYTQCHKNIFQHRILKTKYAMKYEETSTH